MAQCLDLVIERLGVTYVRELTVAAVEAYIAARVKEWVRSGSKPKARPEDGARRPRRQSKPKGRPRKVSLATANHEARALAAACKWAKASGLTSHGALGGGYGGHLGGLRPGPWAAQAAR